MYTATGWLKVKKTNDSHFPQIETAVDSLGNTATRLPGGRSISVDTQQVLRPGQQVRFTIEVSDPNGEDVDLKISAPSLDSDVTIRHGIITWNIREEDISDPANMFFYVCSRRAYHRDKYGDRDDSAFFSYRVLPRA
jgi:hypothetical protein